MVVFKFLGFISLIHLCTLNEEKGKQNTHKNKRNYEFEE